MRTGNRCKRAKGEEGEEERTSARMCKCIQMCTVLSFCNLYSSVDPCRNASMRVCECERWRFPGCSVKAWNALPRRKIPSHAVVNHQAGMSNAFCHFPNVHLSFAFLCCAPPHNKVFYYISQKASRLSNFLSLFDTQECA